MKKLNVIIVYDENEENLLMCKREKEPYKGLYNLVGGKLEDGEEEYCAAYRDEVNKLYWLDKNENYFDITKFAGEGNIGHMLEQVNLNKDILK